MGLGISIYPEHASFEQNAAYIESAGRRGFTRVFSCLLSVDGSREAIVRDFRRLHDLMHANGMQVILDVSPAVFNKLGITYSDLGFFAEVRADGIRLDEAFTGSQVAAMTHNPYGLKVELNASTHDGSLEATLANAPDRTRLLMCHNFYPQRYSGLDLAFFERESRAVKETGTRLAAFVCCGDHAAFGPWPGADGLPTLECHRDLPLDLQARHLAAMGLVDDVIVSNCFPTEAELDALAQLQVGRVMFRAELEGSPCEVEEKILFDFAHKVRGDLSAYLLRSTMSRVAYADASIEPRNTRDLTRGDVVVVNNSDARYKGELQIVLQDIPNDGRRNVVAHIPQAEQLLMGYLGSWTEFGFIR